MNLPRFLTRATSRRQVILRKHAKGFVWMCMYSSQFTCVKVDWNGIKPSFIPIHFNTHRLKYAYIQIRPKKDAKDVVVFFLKLGGKHRFVVSLHCSWASLQTTKQWAFSPRPSCVYPQPIALSVSSCSIVTMPCMHACVLWRRKVAGGGELGTSAASLSTDETKRGATTNKLSRGDHHGQRPPAGAGRLGNTRKEGRGAAALFDHTTLICNVLLLDLAHLSCHGNQ
jgi:hypothetical protein